MMNPAQFILLLHMSQTTEAYERSGGGVWGGIFMCVCVLTPSLFLWAATAKVESMALCTSVVVPPSVGMRGDCAARASALQNARHTCVATASMEADLTRLAAQRCEASGNVHSIA